MHILLINPPHKAIGSRLAGEHLPPLGLLSIAGPLIDAGHSVELLDADYSNMPLSKIVQRTAELQPDLVMMGHSGSTSAQPIIDELSRLIKSDLSSVKIIVGGVYPTYHFNDILKNNTSIDMVVRGEGEETVLHLANALEHQLSLDSVYGIAYRTPKGVHATKPAAIIQNLDRYRVAWELMEGYNYTYWGHKKAVVIQFSRGCPYPCNYCGQSLFWKKWRNRNPQLLADEMEYLHRQLGVEVFNFADENPSTNKREWKAFLEALIEKRMDIILVGSIRADNIVRDEKHLHLYKKAGFERFLLGIEGYDEELLKQIKKAGSSAKDKKAIELLRAHNILSMATYVFGFGDERLRDMWNSLRQLLAYDPDQIQLLYATPHRWTPYYQEVRHKRIIQNDLRYWDYKHQILETKSLKPWVIICTVKLIEVIMQTRPQALFRRFFHKDRRLRQAMYWYNNIGKRVWVFELVQFFFVVKRMKYPGVLGEMENGELKIMNEKWGW
ncbi:MAG: magnesium-protoporphyrin IX monomethyl ester anaerobic oxidative cyclase [Flavobacteriales bacterium]|nr:magnesium-protoporphyrin IX monomethyl ester anaerobic oxidative cyclase [Flavobacteriales bacterium]